MKLTFDGEDPPAEPPPQAERLMWRLAYQVNRDHQPDGQGLCGASTCGSLTGWPCAAHRLAHTGFVVAMVYRRPFVRPEQECRTEDGSDSGHQGS